MLPIDEFEKDLRRAVPRPLAPNVILNLEGALQAKESRQDALATRSKTSRLVLASVWTSGFAIGAAAMLFVTLWSSSPAEQAAPRIPPTPLQVRSEPLSIAVAPSVAPEKTLISYPIWTHRDRHARRVSEVLTVGSDPSTVICSSPNPFNAGSVLDPAAETRSDEMRQVNAVPNRFRSPAPRTQRELIDQILNEI